MVQSSIGCNSRSVDIQDHSIRSVISVQNWVVIPLSTVYLQKLGSQQPLWFVHLVDVSMSMLWSGCCDLDVATRCHPWGYSMHIPMVISGGDMTFREYNSITKRSASERTDPFCIHNIIVSQTTSCYRRAQLRNTPWFPIYHGTSKFV